MTVATTATAAAARPPNARRDRIDRAVVLALLGSPALACWAALGWAARTWGPLRWFHPPWETGAGIAAVAAWLRTLPGADAAAGLAAAPLAAASWSLPTLGVLALLWTGVAAASLLPAAAPQLTAYARVRRARRARWVHPHVAAFLLGCLCVCGGCGLVGAGIDGLLHGAGALDDTLAIAHPAAGALGLVGAGVYQWTPAKHAALANGREPLAFVLTQWRRGVWGAFRMGAADARGALGCSWPLLTLALPAGVANLPVIVASATLILAERRLPGGHVLACATGLGLVAWGTALLFP